MAIRYDLLYLIIIAFALAYVTNIIIHNTINYNVISDANRYIQEIKNGQSNRTGLQLLSPLISGTTEDFVMKTNFLLFLSVGWLIYSSTKSWKITFLTWLGFSVSLLAYFSLLAQAIVIIMGLWLWTKIDPFEDKHVIRNHILYVFAGALAFETHKFGLPLVFLIYAIRVLDSRFRGKVEFNVWARRLAVLSFIGAGVLLLAVFFSSTTRVSFFYPFILPMSMGAFDCVWWLGLIGVMLWMLLKCENNTKELIIVSICFLATIVNYLFISKLEIDFWRILIIPELIILLKVGQSKQIGNLLKWAPWFLIIIGVERLILGILI